MRFLLCNDDGYFSPGLSVLASAFSKLGAVTVVAPERDRSGASNSLTLDRPLSLRLAASGFYYVNGTPTDCVHLAMTSGKFVEPFDMVISGVNHGANMGDDTIYSGTVAAATEGFLLGVPSLAVSLNGQRSEFLETAAETAVDIVRRWIKWPLSEPILWNLNIPDVPMAQLKKTVVTRLGRRHRAEAVVQTKTPRGEVVYWIGAAGQAQDNGPGTDFYAVESHNASLTPLQIDLTSTKKSAELHDWLLLC